MRLSRILVLCLCPLSWQAFGRDVVTWLEALHNGTLHLFHKLEVGDLVFKTKDVLGGEAQAKVVEALATVARKQPQVGWEELGGPLYCRATCHLPLGRAGQLTSPTTSPAAAPTTSLAASPTTSPAASPPHQLPHPPPLQSPHQPSYQPPHLPATTVPAPACLTRTHCPLVLHAGQPPSMHAHLCGD